MGEKFRTELEVAGSEEISRKRDPTGVYERKIAEDREAR